LFRFYDRRDAEDAIDAMDGRTLDGRELRVGMAKHGRPEGGRGGGGGRRGGYGYDRRRRFVLKEFVLTFKYILLSVY